MRFSVIIPVFNREKSVLDSIFSIKKQTSADWEIIVIDDGSTDHSYEICHQISSEDSRIKVFHQENGGVSSARNQGIKKAKGDYILFLDSDDQMEPNALEVLENTICSSGFPDAVCFGLSRKSGVIWQPDTDICGVTFSSEMIFSHFLPDHLNLVPHGKYFLQPFVWNKCYKKQVIDRANIRFDEEKRTWEDGGFFIEFMAKADSLYLIKNRLYWAGDSGQNDHLGAFYNAYVLRNYIQTCKKYDLAFGNRYPLDCPYTSMYRLELICFILQRLRRSQEFDLCVNMVFNDPTIKQWTKKAGIRSSYTALVKATFATQNRWLLRQALSDDRNMMRRLLRHIRRFAHFNTKG